MNRVQSFIARLFRIIPASEKRITIIEPHSFRENVIRNKIWYHGDSAELEQFFQKTAKWDVEKARFWAAHASGSVRKIHSGIVQMVIDRYRDIVLADLDGVEFDNEDLDTVWADLYKKASSTMYWEKRSATCWHPETVPSRLRLISAVSTDR